MPAGARLGRGNARAARPRPCSPPRPPAPPRLWRAEPRAPLAAAAADVAPAAPRSQQCRAGKTKGIRFASFPASHLHSGRTARDPGPIGAAPPGAPSHARPDLSPPTPVSTPPCPPASQAQGLPHPVMLGLLIPRDLAVLSPRRAARSSEIASGPRARTHRAPGASPGRLGNRRQTPPPLPSGRRCAPGFSFLFFFFFPNPDGKEGDRLLRIHQLSSQQQKSWSKGRPASAIGGEGRRTRTPRQRSTSGRSVWTQGWGR